MAVTDRDGLALAQIIEAHQTGRDPRAVVAAYRESCVAEEQTARRVVERKLLESEAARLKAEGERDKLQSLINDEWDDECRAECDSYSHQEDCPAIVLANALKDRRKRAEAAEARLRAVIEVADRVMNHSEFPLAEANPHLWLAVCNYRAVLDAQPPASPEPEASPRVGHAFALGLTPRGYGRVPGLERMTCVHCGLPWSQHGEGR